MALHLDIKKNMQAALKGKREVELQTLRMLLTACTNFLVEQKRKPTEETTDPEMHTIIRKLLKQRKEAATHYENAGRKEQAASEREEASILEAYLPPALSEDKLKEIITQVQEEMDFRTKSTKGKFMKAIMEKTQGTVDGSVVANLLDEVLS